MKKLFLLIGMMLVLRTGFAMQGGWAGSDVTPGGSDTQVQFNDGGSFGGTSDLTFNKTTKVLTIGGTGSQLGFSGTMKIDGSTTNMLNILDSDSTNVYSLSSAGLATIPTINLGSSTGASLTAANGIVTLQGLKGGGVNENVTFDFETSSNTIGISSTTNATVSFTNTTYIGGIDKYLSMNKGTYQINFGMTSIGNDNLQLSIPCNHASGSGYFSLMETGDGANANRSPAATSVNPVFRIYSADASIATPWIDFSHDNTDGNIQTGLGKINLKPATDVTITTGNLVMNTVAKGIVLKQGANGKCGTFVLNGATAVDISNTSIAVTDVIIISLNTVGGTVGVQPHIVTITAATGFSVIGTAGDTSTYNYAIISNAA